MQRAVLTVALLVVVIILAIALTGAPTLLLLESVLTAPVPQATLTMVLTRSARWPTIRPSK